MKVRAKFTSLAMLLVLAACQSPVVPVRSFTYDASFDVDGRRYVFSTSYQCHYEDVAWVSERGPGWHIRAGAASVRIIGRLDDGTPFEILPSSAAQETLCAEHVGNADSQLFIATPGGDVVGISSGTDKSAPHRARLLESSLSMTGTGSAAFADREHRPAPTKPARRFYTVQATYYDDALWKEQPAIAAMVRGKTIRWLEDARVWPFVEWTDADVAVERARQSSKQLSGYDDAGKRFPVTMAGETWRFTGPNDDARIWRPLRTDANPPRWIEYAGYRIELPVRNSNRLFYERKSDRLIEFRVVYVDLW